MLQKRFMLGEGVLQWLDCMRSSWAHLLFLLENPRLSEDRNLFGEHICSKRFTRYLLLWVKSLDFHLLCLLPTRQQPSTLTLQTEKEPTNIEVFSTELEVDLLQLLLPPPVVLSSAGRSLRHRVPRRLVAKMPKIDTNQARLLMPVTVWQKRMRKGWPTSWEIDAVVFDVSTQIG